MSKCNAKVSVMGLTFFTLLSISMTAVNAAPKCVGAAVGSCSNLAAASCSNYYVKNSSGTGMQCMWNGKFCSNGGVQCDA